MIQTKKILLADDDADDRMFFEDALKQVSMQTELSIVKDGVELMLTLDDTVPPSPHAIFLDLNMPRKNGFECLREIREDGKLRNIPVVIFSTSSSSDIVDKTYDMGANYYICKPHSFELLKKAIMTVLSLNLDEDNKQPAKANYYLTIA